MVEKAPPQSKKKVGGSGRKECVLRERIVSREEEGKLCFWKVEKNSLLKERG